MTKVYLLLALLPLGVAILPGCEWLERRSFEADLKERCARADSRVAQVDLVEFTTRELEPMGQVTRLLITPTAIHVDNTALVASWWRSASVISVPWADEPLTKTPSEWGTLDEFMIDAPNVVQMPGGKLDAADLRDGRQPMLIGPLYYLLRRIVRISKTYAARSGNVYFRGRLSVYVSEKTNYATLQKVLYTAGQAEYENFRFAVRADESIVELPIIQAKCSPECGTRPQQGDGDDCMFPMFSLSPQKLEMLTTRCHKGQRQQETGAEQFCRSFANVGGKANLVELKHMLAEDKRRMTPCTGAYVDASEHVLWSDLASLLETLRQDGGFTRQTFIHREHPLGVQVRCNHYPKEQINIPILF